MHTIKQQQQQPVTHNALYEEQIFSKELGEWNAVIHVEVHLSMFHQHIPSFAVIGHADANGHKYRDGGTVFP